MPPGDSRGGDPFAIGVLTPTENQQEIRLVIALTAYKTGHFLLDFVIVDDDGDLEPLRKLVAATDPQSLILSTAITDTRLETLATELRLTIRRIPTDPDR